MLAVDSVVKQHACSISRTAEDTLLQMDQAGGGLVAPA